MQSGIYQIRCLANDRIYIGSAVNIKERWKHHRGALCRGEHDNQHLQRAWAKHGRQMFTWEVLRVVENKEDLLQIEQEHLDHLWTLGPDARFNICPTAGSKLGAKHTPESRSNISKALKSWMTPERRAQMSAARKGIQPSDAFMMASAAASRKARKGRKGIQPSTAFMAAAAVSVAARKGKPGRKHTPETRAQMSLARKGRKPTPATRAKLSAAQSRRWERERLAKISPTMEEESPRSEDCSAS